MGQERVADAVSLFALNTWKWCATVGDIQVKVLLDDTEWGNGANTYIPAAGGTVYPFFYSCEYCFLAQRRAYE